MTSVAEMREILSEAVLSASRDTLLEIADILQTDAMGRPLDFDDE